MYHPHGSRRTGKELFLNYGIFVFSLIGAVSIWMRMYSWMSFLHVAIGVWIVLLSLIKILDRRIFYYRYFISDEVLVSALLILGFFTTVSRNSFCLYVSIPITKAELTVCTDRESLC